MKKGGKYQLFVPSSLAYGPRGAGQEIGPNAALIFDVELIDIKPAVAPAPSPAAAAASPAPSPEKPKP
jgi:FKBP-type peptidyl-prolyl cis-trans isomerase FkpA